MKAGHLPAEVFAVPNLIKSKSSERGMSAHRRWSLFHPIEQLTARYRRLKHSLCHLKQGHIASNEKAQYNRKIIQPITSQSTEILQT